MSIRPIYTYTPIGRPQEGDRRSFGSFKFQRGGSFREQTYKQLRALNGKTLAAWRKLDKLSRERK